MKLTVCFKIMPDYGMVSAADWQPDEKNRVDLGFARQVFNCYEESALETALALGGSDAGKDNAWERTALTIDDAGADLFLRHLYAVGYDRAVRIAADMDLRFSPQAVSSIIAAHVFRSLDQDLVILGPRAGEGDNCQTGPLVAERLGWPCIADVTRLAWDRSGYLTVWSCSDGANLVHTAALPLVLVLGNAPDNSFLRVPTLKQKMAARKKTVQVCSLADLHLDPGHLAEMDPPLVRLEPCETDRNCTFIETGTPEKKAHQLFEQYIKPRFLT